MEENYGERVSERVRELLIFSCCCWFDFALLQNTASTDLRFLLHIAKIE